MTTLNPSLNKQPLRAPWYARPLLAGLERLLYGQLLLVAPDGSQRLFSGRHAGPDATLHIHDWRALRRIALAGDIGLAEAWRDGQASSPDWVALMRLALQNEPAVEQAIHGSWLGKIGYLLRHLGRANTRKGSRRNIHAHYDLGNAFGHLAVEVADAYAACDAVRAKGGKVVREAGPMKHGTTVIAFVEDPDGYKIEFIQKGTR